MAYSNIHSFHRHPLYDPSEDLPIQPAGDSCLLELRDTVKVQTRMFPAVLPAVPLIDHALDWRTARELTSDYFDCFAMPGGSLGLAIGEVSGRGMAAALMTPVLHGMVRGMGMAGDRSLMEMVSKIDETFSRICPEGCFATLFVAEIDPARRRLRYVNAGHEPPLVVRTAKHREHTILLEATGSVIGMLRHSRCRERVCSMAPDDVVVAMTDGVCDAENADGQVWGRERLLGIIHECEGLPATYIVEEIFTALDRATEGAAIHNDMTLWLGHLQNEVKRPRSLVETEAVRTAVESEQFAAALAGI